MKYGKVHAQGVTLCLPFPCFIIQVPFLFLISSKVIDGEKGKGSKRGEITRMPFFWMRTARNRRDRKQGEGRTKQGSKKMTFLYIYLLSPVPLNEKTTLLALHR